MTNADDTIIPQRFPDGEFKCEGLTKREYFAAMAMQGWIGCQSEGFSAGGNDYAEVIAERAAKCADALIKELNKEK